MRVTRRARELETKRRYDYLDANLTGEFETFGLEHKLLIGVNAGKDQVAENRLKFFNSSNRNATTGVCPVGGTCLDIALYNPDYSAYPDFASLPALNPALADQANLLTHRIIDSKNWGIYLSDLITLTDWLKVSASLRKFSEKSIVQPDSRNQPQTVNTRITKRDFLPSFGILFQPQNNITIYGSYAESFVPADPGLYDINGNNPFKPLEGKQYEAGVKVERLLDGRFNATAAVYRIDQIGQITQFQCPLGSCSAQIGKARSNGFEVEGNYEPIDNWQFIFGYSHIKARVMTSIPTQAFQIGRPLANVAKNAANLWTRYDWQNGFGVGLGVTYTGPRAGILPTSAADLKPLDLPSYLLVDAGLYYKTDSFSMNLKLGNILDKKYFESSGAGSSGRVQIQAGQPRYATLTTRFSF
jgi:iron complex outermembrane receptor protein